jgi:hypothetical protein
LIIWEIFQQEYILEQETVNKNLKIRAVVTDSTHKEHMRQINLDNEDWQKLYNNNKVDLVKLDNKAKNEDFVLGLTIFPSLNQSKVVIDNLKDVDNKLPTFPALQSIDKPDKRTSVLKLPALQSTDKTDKRASLTDKRASLLKLPKIDQPFQK